MKRSNFLNRRRWAIDQQQRARAIASADLPATDAIRDLEKLRQLRELAAMIDIANAPHMESTLRAVQAEIKRLEAHYKGE